MSLLMGQVEMDEGCTHLEGYKLGFNDAYLQMVDKVNSLIEIKAEYDRAFCILRQEGVTRDDTKQLSTALSMLLANYRKVLELNKFKINELDFKIELKAADIKNATGQHVKPIINPHLNGIENS